jgi:hypothetical protein
MNLGVSSGNGLQIHLTKTLTSKGAVMHVARRPASRPPARIDLAYGLARTLKTTKAHVPIAPLRGSSLPAACSADQIPAQVPGKPFPDHHTPTVAAQDVAYTAGTATYCGRRHDQSFAHRRQVLVHAGFSRRLIHPSARGKGPRLCPTIPRRGAVELTVAAHRPV